MMTNDSIKDPIQRLRKQLLIVPHGEIDKEGAGHIRALLAACWDLLEGSGDKSMAAHKLDRAEQLSWNPPVLSFEIERHGATVLGSTRAELQDWTVNLDTNTVHCSGGRYRQLARAAPRLNVTPIVACVCDAVLEGPKSQCSLVKEQILIWHGERLLEIKHGSLISGGYPQTLAGRRRRFRQKLEDRLGQLGWQLRIVKRSMIFEQKDSNHISD